MLRRASETIAHFPAISELETIADELMLKKETRQYWAPPKFRDNSETGPWPPAVMGLMMCMENAERTGVDKGFAFGKSYCRLSDDEAMTLLHGHKRGCWDDPDCLKIIERIRGTAAVESVLKRARYVLQIQKQEAKRYEH